MQFDLLVQIFNVQKELRHPPTQHLSSLGCFRESTSLTILLPVIFLRKMGKSKEFANILTLGSENYFLTKLVPCPIFCHLYNS